MSMILELHALSDEDIAKLLRDPALAWRVVAPDDPDAYEQARRASSRGLLARLFGGKKEPESLSDDCGALRADLDKSWHGLHYLLTGEAASGAPPLGFLLAGGTDVGDVEVGYGPARVFQADETRTILEALSALSDAELRSRFDAQDMMAKKIYPDVWSRSDEDVDGYLMENVSSLRGFLAEAVRRRLGMMIALT